MDIRSRKNDSKQKKQQLKQCNAGDNREKSTKTDAQAQGPPPPSSSSLFTSRATSVSLTRALLNEHFQLQLPSLPEGHLCPPLLNRANYMLAE